MQIYSLESTLHACKGADLRASQPLASECGVEWIQPRSPVDQAAAAGNRSPYSIVQKVNNFRPALL